MSLVKQYKSLPQRRDLKVLRFVNSARDRTVLFAPFVQHPDLLSGDKKVIRHPEQNTESYRTT